MDIKYGDVLLEERARDILTGIGLQPNNATVQYVTAALVSIVSHAVDYSIELIKEGVIKEREDLSQLKDAFVAQPKSIEEFMTKDITPAALFLKSKAKGAYLLRRATNLSGWLATYSTQYLAIQDIKPTQQQIEAYERAHEALGKLLKAVSK